MSIAVTDSRYIPPDQGEDLEIELSLFTEWLLEQGHLSTIIHDGPDDLVKEYLLTVTLESEEGEEV